MSSSIIAQFHYSPSTGERALLLTPRNARERAYAMDYVYRPELQHLSVEQLQWLISSFLCGYRSTDGSCSCGGHA